MLMTTGNRAVAIAAIVATLPTVILGQEKPPDPVKTAAISGRIVDPAGTPIQNLGVSYRDWRGSPIGTVRTGQDGSFGFPIDDRVTYQIALMVTETPPVFKGIGSVGVVDGLSLNMGDIILKFSPKHEAIVDAAGPIRITPLPSTDDPSPSGVQKSIDAVYVACDSSVDYCAGGSMRIFHNDGTDFQPPKEKDQVGWSSVAISDDNRAVGWLVDYGNCCTSYPIPLKLVVYRPGRPLRRFGGGMGVFDWTFVNGGMQVAFYTDTVHGNLAPHFELRDVRTEQMLSKWDGHLNRNSPPWTRLLKFD